MNKSFRVVVLILLVLAFVRSVSAQTVHGYPGKLAYASAAEWPFVDGQCHWVPGGGSPTVDPPNTLVSNMAHTHAGVKAPIWGEVGGPGFSTFDIPVTMKVFHTDGGIYGADAQVFGAADHRSIELVMDTFPVVGDPSGLVSVNGHLRLNMTEAVAIGVPLHGWFNIRLSTQTFYGNGDIVDNETWIPLYSVVDPTAPEVNVGGTTTSKCSAVNPNDTDPVPWGLNLLEFRQMSPILAPFSTPQLVQWFGYSYAAQGAFPPGTSELLLDADFHMGIPGVPIPTTFQSTGNFSQLSPATMELSPTPMGLQPHQHRLTFVWDLNTGDGFDDNVGHVSAGQDLRSLLSFIVTVGDSPTDSGPVTLWTVDAVAPTPSSPPPPSPTWVTFFPVFCQNTATGELKMFALASCADVP